MDKQEAARILAEELARFRAKPYTELVKLIGDVQVIEVTGPSGADYCLEFLMLWDGKPDGDLLVSGGIDDGGFWAALSPLCEDFIMTPEGEFVGE